MPGDMRPRNPQVAEEGTGISDLLPDHEWSAGTTAPRKAAAVVRDHAIGVGDAGLSQQGENASASMAP